MNSVRTLIVDDSSEFLRHAGAFVLELPGVDLVGWAYLGREALELVRTLDVDLLLVDVSLPGMGGLEVTRVVKTLAQPPRVILVTLHDDPAYRTAAAEAGADGYIPKRDLVAELPGLIEGLFPRQVEWALAARGGPDAPPAD